MLAHIRQQSGVTRSASNHWIIRAGGWVCRDWWIQDGDPAHRGIVYVIASIPYSLATWSGLGMPQNGHHDHQTLRRWTFVSGDTSCIRYIKPHHQIYRILGRESPERLLPFVMLTLLGRVFDAMTARAQICLEL